LINPIIVRHARTQFRLEHVGPIIILAAYLLILVLAFFLTYIIGAYQGISWEDCLRNYWYGLMGVQIFVLVVVGGIRVAGSVVREREQKRFDFQLVTGMSPWRIAEGEMVGNSLFYYFLILCALPFSLLCVLGGGVDWGLFGYSYLIIFTAAFFAHCWALLASTVSRTHAGAIVITLIVIALVSAAVLLKKYTSGTLSLLSVISPFYLPLSEVRSASDLRQMGFFNEQFPQLFAVAVAYVFFGLWALNGAVRKIRNPGAPYLSKLQAVIFAVVFLTVVCGLLLTRTPGPGETWSSLFYVNTVIYLTVMLLLLFVLAFILTPSVESYTRLVRRRTRSFWYAVFGERSLFLINMFVLFGVSVAVYFGVFVQAFLARAPKNAIELTRLADGKMPLMHIFSGFLFVLLAMLFYSMVIQLCTLLWKRAGREIAAMIILALVLLPVLSEIGKERQLAEMGSVLEMGFIHVFNPVVVLISILPTGARTAGVNLTLAALVFYPVFSAILGTLLFLRVKHIHSFAAPLIAMPSTSAMAPATSPTPGSES
jgi:hypothetical protein